MVQWEITRACIGKQISWGDALSNWNLVSDLEQRISYSTVPSLKPTARPWKWMVVRRSFPFGACHLVRCYCWWFRNPAKPVENTLQGINISHLGKKKIIFKMPFFGGYVGSLEKIPWFTWFKAKPSQPMVLYVAIFFVHRSSGRPVYVETSGEGIYHH